MIKNFLFVFIILLLIFSSSPKAQIADVSNEITISDNCGGQKTLVFGLDSTASDGIDINLGESDLPPFPPAGAFEARFFLPENNFAGTLGSYSDYRNAVLPFTGQKEFRLAYQVGCGTEIKINWDFPGNVSGILQDIITGTLINVSMQDSGSFLITNPSAFNKLKMLISYQGVIPVELLSFDASFNGSVVQLHWQTATETNNSGFEVQRKFKYSDSWQNVGFVEGAGTSTEINDYYFVDDQTTGGAMFYRLKQIDLNGVFKYSSEISINFENLRFILYQNYPNPFNPSTTISFSLAENSNVRLRVYNQLGEMVEEIANQQMDAGNYKYNWNASKFSSGIYYCELISSEYTRVQKMILLK